MLCLTLTLAKSVPTAAAEQTVEQLVASLNEHPDAVGGEATGFKAIGQRQVQGYLSSPDETVGFILSIARSGIWGVHLGLLPKSLNIKETSQLGPVLDQAASASSRALRAPGGVQVEMLAEGVLIGQKQAPEVGPVEATLQLLCAIERRRSDEGQEAGLIINAGQSQAKAAKSLGVSQQAISSRLQAGYWYESRKVAYWLAVQIQQLVEA